MARLKDRMCVVQAVYMFLYMAYCMLLCSSLLQNFCTASCSSWRRYRQKLGGDDTGKSLVSVVKSEYIVSQAHNPASIYAYDLSVHVFAAKMLRQNSG